MRKKDKKIKTGGVDIEVNIFVNVYECERVSNILVHNVLFFLTLLTKMYDTRGHFLFFSSSPPVYNFVFSWLVCVRVCVWLCVRPFKQASVDS